MAEFDIMYNEGISKVGDIIDLATSAGNRHQARSVLLLWRYSPGPGRENAKEFLRQNGDLCCRNRVAVRQRAVGGDIPLALAAEGGDGGDE